MLRDVQFAGFRIWHSRSRLSVIFILTIFLPPLFHHFLLSSFLIFALEESSFWDISRRPEARVIFCSKVKSREKVAQLSVYDFWYNFPFLFRGPLAIVVAYSPMKRVESKVKKDIIFWGEKIESVRGLHASKVLPSIDPHCLSFVTRVYSRQRFCRERCPYHME